MLDIGLSEIFLIVVVGLVVIKPKDLPVVVRHVMGFLREVRSVYAGLKVQMHQVMEEAGMDDIRQNVTTIIDMEGNPQKAYDVRELENLAAVKPVKDVEQ